MKRFKELSAGAKAGIFFAAVLAAAFAIGGGASIKAKIRAAKRADMPTVVFSELSPETLTWRRTHVTPLENGDKRVTNQGREISEPEDVRGILELLDGAKLKALTPYADWMNSHPDYKTGMSYSSPYVSVVVKDESFYMDIAVWPEREESIVTALVSSGEGMVYWVFSAQDEQGFVRLRDGLWNHEGGKVLQGSTEVVHAAA